MTVYVTEFSGFFSGRQSYPGIPNGTPVQSQTLSSGSTYQLSARTQMVLVSADAGAWLFMGSSFSTGVASTVATSTNQGNNGACIRIPAGVAPIPIAAQPFMRLLVNST